MKDDRNLLLVPVATSQLPKTGNVIDLQERRDERRSDE